MKKVSAVLALVAVTALPSASSFADPIKKGPAKKADPCAAIFKKHASVDGRADRSPANEPCSIDVGPDLHPDPIGDLIKKLQSMPLDQKIREAFLAISLPIPVGPFLALLDAYAVEKSEQKKIEIKGKIEALLKKYKLGKYATGEMKTKKAFGAYLYQSKSYKPVKVATIEGADKEKKKTETGKNAAQGG